MRRVLLRGKKYDKELRERIKNGYTINWYVISKYKPLSMRCIREFQDKVSWFYISANQNLSEDFIREFQDKVDWDGISEFQILSEDFIEEFMNELDLGIIKERTIYGKYFKKLLSLEFIESLIIMKELTAS